MHEEEKEENTPGTAYKSTTFTYFQPTIYNGWKQMYDLQIYKKTLILQGLGLVQATTTERWP